jgi:hypothetical protein
MRFFQKTKDGGPDSPVNAYFLFEIKSCMSIAILKFNAGTREAFHTHAFNALTWFIAGDLVEQDISGEYYAYARSWIPKVTRRHKNHKVIALEDSWCLTIRGPWCDTWTEDTEEKTTVLTHGRNIVSEKLK